MLGAVGALPPTQYFFMASHSPRFLSLTRRAFSSSSSSSLGGVSMVQGASRGIDLEFVRFFAFFSYFCITHCFHTIWVCPHCRNFILVSAS
ncbi:hypothetical protein LR48_Vigan02g261900 [Vigna angularis]|uniref:Uncharacterized protein n=1 Tax=Phaseolus angularis TaxID=3914 RepID=A0A0L9U249_PHAAN|nr:hypothetical protein LR48_Vigan02g261900 [Vigna angularis]